MTVIQSLLFLAYPALIYLALQVAEPRLVALIVLGTLALRAASSSRRGWLGYARAFRLPALAVVAATGVAALWNQRGSLLLTPALISFALLVTFAGSLWRSESVVEALARAQLGSLGRDESRYCRRVTMVWCAFFLVNGLVATHLALSGRLVEWTVYTGMIAYLLMGLVFASEFVYRQWRFRRYLGAPTDVLFRRVFPPRSP